jgi:hypothetical protein
MELQSDRQYKLSKQRAGRSTATNPAPKMGMAYRPRNPRQEHGAEYRKHGMEYQQLGKRGDYSTKGPDVTIDGRLVAAGDCNDIAVI